MTTERAPWVEPEGEPPEPRQPVPIEAEMDRRFGLGPTDSELESAIEADYLGDSTAAVRALFTQHPPALGTQTTDQPTEVAEASDHPMTVIAAGLAASARGEEVDQDAMQDAGATVAAANLLRGGMSMDAIEQAFERPHVFKFSYDRATDEIGIDIEWDDEDDRA